MTIADLSLYAGYARAKGAVPETCEGLPNLERWAKELGGRPAIQRATKF
jgi:glutathione S-transferase